MRIRPEHVVFQKNQIRVNVTSVPEAKIYANLR